MTQTDEREFMKLIEQWSRGDDRVVKQLNKLATDIHRNTKSKSLDWILGLEE